MKLNYIPQVKVLVDEDDKKAIERVLERGIFVKGPEVDNFEKEFSKYIGVRHSIAVNSGTTALFVIFSYIRKLQPPKSKYNVIQSNTFLATANSSELAGYSSLFVDIDKNYFNMSYEDFLSTFKKYNHEIGIVTPVHLYGNPTYKIEEISEIIETNGGFLVEDSCQAHGALYKKNKVGSLGFASAFSLFPTKNLGTVGDGGVITTNDSDFYEFAKSFINAGRKEKPDNLEFPGHNFRLSEIQAAVARERLKKLDVWNQKRRKLAKIYIDILGDDVVYQQETPSSKHVYHQFSILVKNRDFIRKELEKEGIQTSIKYSVPLPETNWYNSHRVPKFLPFSHEFASKLISLPMSQWHTESEIEFVATTLKRIIRK